MQLFRNRRCVAALAVVATAASGSLGVVLQSQADQQAQPQDQVSRSISSSSESIPFDPPVVHPGYGSQLKAFEKPTRSKRMKSANRDLLFRDDDRKTFKALHPFLLEEPRSIDVQEKPVKRGVTVGRFVLIGSNSDNNLLRNVDIYERAQGSDEVALRAQGYIHHPAFIPMVRAIGHAESARQSTKTPGQWILDNAIMRSNSADRKMSATHFKQFTLKAD